MAKTCPLQKFLKPLHICENLDIGLINLIISLKRKSLTLTSGGKKIKEPSSIYAKSVSGQKISRDGTVSKGSVAERR